MKVLLLCLLIASPAFSECGQFVMCNSPMDYYVPQNLMRLSEAAEEARQTRFLRNLKCWNISDDNFGRVACEVKGEEIVWEDERQRFYVPMPTYTLIEAGDMPKSSLKGKI